MFLFQIDLFIKYNKCFLDIIYNIKKKEGSVCWLTGWAVNSIVSAIEGSIPFLPNHYFVYTVLNCYIGSFLFLRIKKHKKL